MKNKFMREAIRLSLTKMRGNHGGRFGLQANQRLLRAELAPRFEQEVADFLAGWVEHACWQTYSTKSWRSGNLQRSNTGQAPHFGFLATQV